MAGKPQESARCGSYAQIKSKHQLRDAWAIRQDRAETAFITQNGKRYATARPHHGKNFMTAEQRAKIVFQTTHKR